MRWLNPFQHDCDLGVEVRRENTRDVIVFARECRDCRRRDELMVTGMELRKNNDRIVRTLEDKITYSVLENWDLLDEIAFERRTYRRVR